MAEVVRPDKFIDLVGLNVLDPHGGRALRANSSEADSIVHVKETT
jgi:hypothetical protein